MWVTVWQRAKKESDRALEDKTQNSSHFHPQHHPPDDDDDDDQGDDDDDDQGGDDEDIMEAIWSLALVREVSGGFFPNCSGRTRQWTALP